MTGKASGGDGGLFGLRDDRGLQAQLDTTATVDFEDMLGSLRDNGPRLT